MAELESESEVVSDDTGSDGGLEDQNVTTPEESTSDYDVVDPESQPEDSTANSREPSESPEFNSQLLATAELMGYPRDVAVAYGSPEALKSRLSQDMQYRQSASQGQNYYQQQQQQQQQQIAAQQYQQQPYMVPKYDLQLDPEMYGDDDSMVQEMHALNEHYQQLAQGQWGWIEHLNQSNLDVMQYVQQQQDAYEQQQQQVAYQQSVEFFDQSVGEMPEYADVLGEGNTSEFNPSSTEFKNRDKFFRMWNKEENDYHAAGIALPQDSEMRLRVAERLFGARQAATADQQPTNGMRARDPYNGRYVPTTKTQRPTNRIAKPLGKGIDKAAATADAWYSEREEMLNADTVL